MSAEAVAVAAAAADAIEAAMGKPMLPPVIVEEVSEGNMSMLTPHVHEEHPYGVECMWMEGCDLNSFWEKP